MSRWLAAAFALVSVVASALAVWLVVVDDSEDERASGSSASRSASERPAANAERKPVRFTVSVSGDLLMHDPLLDRALANGGGDEYDFAPFFDAIAPYVREPDLALCHLETPMGPGPPATYPIFNTPTGLAASVRKSGWDACSTASNHSLDQGLEGIRGTVAALDEQGVAHTGSFASPRASERPTILDVRGVKLGYISYTDATNGIPAPTAWAVNEYAAADPRAGADAVLADARRARRQGAEAVIVNLHWGVENSGQPNQSQLSVAKRLTASPLITAVVGQGPHVVQPIWRMNDKFVVFSEGNLVSNQGTGSGLPAATQDGLIALLRFEAEAGKVRVKRVKYVPVWVRPGDYVVLPAEASADSSYADALRASRSRTVATAGSGEGIAPGD
jgi:poly-gamma-glutamate capsule biosynthesis protein CapA/YwtB (metallophosphatase superfamily)